jgi:hypothetical protein
MKTEIGAVYQCTIVLRLSWAESEDISRGGHGSDPRQMILERFSCTAYAVYKL